MRNRWRNEIIVFQLDDIYKNIDKRIYIHHTVFQQDVRFSSVALLLHLQQHQEPSNVGVYVCIYVPHGMYACMQHNLSLFHFLLSLSVSMFSLSLPVSFTSHSYSHCHFTPLSLTLAPPLLLQHQEPAT